MVFSLPIEDCDFSEANRNGTIEPENIWPRVFAASNLLINISASNPRGMIDYSKSGKKLSL